GTAQKVSEGHKGYAKNSYFSSFVGFAPSRDPKLVVLVSIDEPKGDYYGGVVSAPVFKEIMGQSLAYLKVPPDPAYLAENGGEKLLATKPPIVEKKAEAPKNGKATALKTEKPPEPAHQDEDEEAQLPIEAKGNADSEVATGTDDILVPDFTGLSVR